MASEDEINAWFDGILLGFCDLSDDLARNYAVTIFLAPSRPPFDQYTGTRTAELIRLLQQAFLAISTYEPLLQRVKRQFSTSRAPGVRLGLRDTVTIYERFVMYMRQKWEQRDRRLDAAQFDSILKDLEDAVKSGLAFQMRRSMKTIYILPIDDTVIQEKLKATCDLALKCHDHGFMSIFVGLLMEHCSYDSSAWDIPFVFLCAPSGSGKSMFGTNLGRSTPSLHWLYNRSRGGQVQEVYQPFLSISKVIDDAITSDILSFKTFVRRLQGNMDPGNDHDFRLTEDMTSVSYIEEDCKDFDSEFVHLIVSLFEQVFEKKGINDTCSWLEAQFQVKKVVKGKMKLQSGYAKIKALFDNRTRELAARSEELPPLSVFIDECNLLDADAQAHPSFEDCRRIHLIRSMLRIMRVVPILTGTDARASNFCAQPFNSSRGSEYVWVITLNDVPAYKVETLETECQELCEALHRLTHPHPSQQSIVRVLDFLKAVRPYENPWVISLALGYIKQSIPACSVVTLPGLLHDVSTRFIFRKSQPHYFSVGQFSYVMGQYWANDRLRLKNLEEVCINGHLAHLHGKPDIVGKPYFTLKVKNTQQYYYRNPADDPYRPHSYYTPFHQAPLTGLMLFGIDSEAAPHIPFVSTVQGATIARVSALDAILRNYGMLSPVHPDSLTRHSSTGTPTEVLFQASAVVASRASGLRGCTFLVFLSHMIRELDTNRTCYARFESEEGASSTEGSEKDGDEGLDVDSDDEYEAFLESASGKVTPHTKKAKGQQLPYYEFPAEAPQIDVVGPHPFNDIVLPVLAPTGAPAWPKVVVDLLRADTSAAHDPIRLGVFIPSTGTSTFDSEICETNLTAGTTSRAPLPTTKQYGYPGDQLSLDVPAATDSRVVMVAECKQWKKSMALSSLCNQVVVKKFVKEGSGCKTFMVLTLRASRFGERYVQRHPAHLKTINEAGFFVWKLSRTSGDRFELMTVPNQSTRVTGSKDIVIVDLSRIWRDPQTLVDVLLKWGHRAD